MVKCGASTCALPCRARCLGTLPSELSGRRQKREGAGLQPNDTNRRLCSRHRYPGDRMSGSAGGDVAHGSEMTDVRLPPYAPRRVMRIIFRRFSSTARGVLHYLFLSSIYFYCTLSTQAGCLGYNVQGLSPLYLCHSPSRRPILVLSKIAV